MAVEATEFLPPDLGVKEFMWAGQDDVIGDFDPSLDEEAREKALEYRTVASDMLEGRNLPKNWREAPTLENIYTFARALCSQEKGADPPRLMRTMHAARVSRVPYRIAYALRPKKFAVRLFVGWTPFEIFQELLGEVEAEHYIEYHEELQDLEQTALRNMRSALIGEYGDPARMRATKDTLERARGKPTERSERLNLDVSVELSAEQLADKRRLLSGGGLGSSE